MLGLAMAVDWDAGLLRAARLDLLNQLMVCRKRGWRRCPLWRLYRITVGRARPAGSCEGLSRGHR